MDGLEPAEQAAAVRLAVAIERERGVEKNVAIVKAVELIKREREKQKGKEVE